MQRLTIMTGQHKKTDMKYSCLLLLLCIGFTQCTPDSTFETQPMEAFVPVYMTTQNAGVVKKDVARPTRNAGKIYVLGNWLFQNDVNEGIHIIDISDKAKPKKIAFISIPLSTEVAVKGNFLYTNNVSDLLTFNIADPLNPTLVKRIPNVFPLVNQNYPPFNNVSFECADPSKGIVINWERKQIASPKCRR